MPRAAEPIEAADFGEWFGRYLDDSARADASPAMEQCGEVIRRDVADHFAREQGPDADWEPRVIDVGILRDLFPEDYARPLLILSGDLFFAAAVRGSPGGINRFSANECVVGVNSDQVPYARIHQTGGRVFLGDVGRVIDIPARPYLWASEKALTACRDTIATYFAEKVL